MVHFLFDALILLIYLTIRVHERVHTVTHASQGKDIFHHNSVTGTS
jgi:hypothetical protein